MSSVFPRKLVVFLLVILGGVCAPPAAGQDLPSWAEPRSHTDRGYGEESMDRELRRQQSRDLGGRPTPSASQKGDGRVGGVRPKAKRCSRDSECRGRKDTCCFGVCTESCDTDECTSDRECSGPGHQVCCGGTCMKRNECEQSTIPIGGPWAPFWTGMLVVLGLAFGVYRLTQPRAQDAAEPRILPAVTWTRGLILSGLVLGGTTLYAVQALTDGTACTPVLWFSLPWMAYWTGGLCAAFVLGGTALVVLRRARFVPR